MKYLKALLFDKKIVEVIKESDVNPNFLYGQLFSGKITLQEYLLAVSEK